MRRLLLTGASGLLGGHILSQARDQWQILALYHHHPIAGEEARQLDLREPMEIENCVRSFAPNVIVHAAANANLDDCEKNPQQALALNTDASRHLAHCAAAVKARLVLLSTDMVFDGEAGMYREEDPVHPISHYGVTKILAEQAIAERASNHVIVRSALIYGRALTGGRSFSQWIEDRLLNGRPVPLYFDQFRTPILADNLAAMILELAAGSFSGLIHCGGGDRIDRYSFGEQLCRLAGYDVTLLRRVSMHVDQPAAPRPRDVSLATGLARTILRTPILSVEEGLRRMLR